MRVAETTSPTQSTNVLAPGSRQVKEMVEVAAQQVAVVEAAQVDVHVVPLDREEVGSCGGFVPSQARQIVHPATVAPVPERRAGNDPTSNVGGGP